MDCASLYAVMNPVAIRAERRGTRIERNQTPSKIVERPDGRIRECRVAFAGESAGLPSGRGTGIIRGVPVRTGTFHPTEITKSFPENLMMKTFGSGFQQNLSTFGYLCVCLNVIFFDYILVTEPFIRQSIYLDLAKEDSYVENLTAILFFLAGILLVIVATTERRIFPRCIYILGCVAFMFAAGEEISWGQRIFDFETPENLMKINDQNEFTIHNITTEQFDLTRIFYEIYIFGTFIFCIIICAAFFCNKNTLLGIPLPSIPLMLSFLVMLSHTPIDSIFLTIEKELLLIFIIYILLSTISNKIPIIIYATATMILILVISWTYHYIDSYIYTGEVQEFLFSLCCFFYSLELLQAQRSVTLFAVQNFPKTALVYIVGICVIPGSIYLVFLKYTRPEMILRYQRETIQFLKDADPIIYSNFDVYLKERSLIYVRDNCSSKDMNIRFFLHIDPIQQSDLPYLRKQYGFDNRNFSFKKFGGFFDGQHCIVVRYLPNYDIAKITTGQFVEDRQIWSGTFTFM